MTAKQLAWWEAYASLEPLDGATTRIVHQLAQIAQILLNTNRDPKSPHPPVKLEDVVLKFGEPEEVRPKQTNEDKIRIFKIMEAAFAAEKGRDVGVA